jgi:hypothetical protein
LGDDDVGAVLARGVGVWVDECFDGHWPGWWVGLC